MLFLTIFRAIFCHSEAYIDRNVDLVPGAKEDAVEGGIISQEITTGFA